MGLRCPCAARDRRVLLCPRRCVAAAELHGFRRLRGRAARPAAPRRARQLRTPRGGTALPNGAGQHRLLRHRRRAALGGRLARCGAAPRGEGRAVEGSLPDRLLPAGGDHARRGGGRLALPLSPAPRAPEPAPRRLRHRPHRLARRSAVGDACHHHARGLEKLRLQHGDLHRRPAEHPGAALRGGAHGRRERLAAVPARDAPDARAHVPLRRRGDDDRLLPALRRAVRHDPGRPGEQHAQRRPPHVRGRVPLVEHGLRRRGRLRAVRDHPAAYARPAPPARAGGHTVRRRVQTFAVHGVLVAAAVLTVLPLVWMVAASLMPTGEASAVPPRLVPSVVTLDHYRALFARLHLTRALLNSAGLATVVTLVSLFLNSMAGYGFAKFRFAGRDRLFRVLLGALVIPAQVAMLPLFLILRALGAIDTYWAVVVPGMARVFGIFLVRQYALGIPDSVLDAARVDGASIFLVLLAIVPHAARADRVVLDDFPDLAGWSAIASEGTHVWIARESDDAGTGMRIWFDINTSGGYVIVRKTFSLALPDNYAFSFRLRGDARPNNFEFKLVDPKGKNVWWRNQRDSVFPRDWQRMTIRKSRLDYAWGTGPGGAPKQVGAIEFAISAGQGGSGSVWIGDLGFEGRETAGP